MILSPTKQVGLIGADYPEKGSGWQCYGLC